MSQVRIFLADPMIRTEQLAAVRHQLPAEWLLTSEPDGAAAILTENVDVTWAMVESAGPSLRLVARLDTGRGPAAGWAARTGGRSTQYGAGGGRRAYSAADDGAQPPPA